MSKNTKDPLGDRMKEYEGAEAGRRLMRRLPVMARLDGRAFHTFCRGLRRPHDERFHELMVATTRHLVEETGAIVGYTQSDEISLTWYSTDPKSQIFFDGRIQKMTSILAATASLRFCKLVPVHLPEKAELSPMFDCRVWQVPNLEEAANTFLWRELDATRNSILAVGQHHFSHSQMQNLNTKQVQEKLFTDCQYNWGEDTPAWAKRGSYLTRVLVETALSSEELAELPLKHNARKNPEMLVRRHRVARVPMPRLGAILNRVATLFEGAAPIINPLESA